MTEKTIVVATGARLEFESPLKRVGVGGREWRAEIPVDWAAFDAIDGGEVTITGMDFGELEARLLAHGITFTEVGGTIHIDIEGYGGEVPGLNRQMETYAAAFKAMEKLPELTDTGPSWEQYRDRRHGRRKQRRGKRR